MLTAFSTHSAAVEESDRAGSYNTNSDWNPEGERYHLTREVTALWSESDPTTLARWWAFFIADHPSEFSESKDPFSTNFILRGLAGRSIRAVSQVERRRAIDAALSRIEIPSHFQETEGWLKNLVDS